MPSYDKADIQRRMHGAVESLKHDLVGLRTGRASTALLDPVQVEVYGANMPLNQVATVSVPEPRLISVQVWDKSNIGPVEKAIRSAGLGLNPVTDGQMIRLPIPDLTEERYRHQAARPAPPPRRRGHPEHPLPVRQLLGLDPVTPAERRARLTARTPLLEQPSHPLRRRLAGLSRPDRRL